MFTGIVETAGRIQSVDPQPGGRRLQIETPDIASDLATGQSISVNGACLTVEAVEDGTFRVFLSAETEARTTFGGLTAGDVVNIERAMPADGRFDGHIVQGHVDTTTTVTDIETVGDDWLFWFAVPESQSQYIVEKGSITIDGVSLTVASLEDEVFSVSIIPMTYEVTNFSELSSGDQVHIEVDVIAKYVSSLLETDGYRLLDE